MQVIDRLEHIALIWATSKDMQAYTSAKATNKVEEDIFSLGQMKQ